VSGLGANVQKVKVRYEAQMRKTWGDAYERQYKAGIDPGMVTATNAGLVSLSFADTDASRFFQYASRCVVMPVLRASPAALSAVRLNSSR